MCIKYMIVHDVLHLGSSCTLIKYSQCIKLQYFWLGATPFHKGKYLLNTCSVNTFTRFENVLFKNLTWPVLAK